jgi:hypothetical protein
MSSSGTFAARSPGPENVSQVVPGEILNLGFGETFIEPFPVRLKSASFGVGLPWARLPHDRPGGAVAAFA